MSAYLAELKRVAGDLDAAAVPWALVGALACSVHAEPRTTKDIDVVVALPDKERAEELLTKLEQIGYGKASYLMDMEPTRKIGYRLGIPGERRYAIPLDLLTTSCGIEQSVVDAAESIELLPSLVLPVASRAHLIAMKILSQNEGDRIRDNADIMALLTGATASDTETTRAALRAITERGFNRGKDLELVLSQFLGAMKKIPDR